MLRVKGLVICFYLGWAGSILQFRQNIIKVGSKLLTCSSNMTLSLTPYTGSVLKRELNFCKSAIFLVDTFAERAWNCNFHTHIFRTLKMIIPFELFFYQPKKTKFFFMINLVFWSQKLTEWNYVTHGHRSHRGWIGANCFSK